MSKKDNTLLYLAIGGAALYFLTKKQATPAVSIVPQKTLPLATSITPTQTSGNGVLNTISQLVNNFIKPNMANPAIKNDPLINWLPSTGINIDTSPSNNSIISNPISNNNDLLSSDYGIYDFSQKGQIMAGLDEMEQY